METTQQYTSGTLDNLNTCWVTFSFNMEGAQSTLTPATRYLKSVKYAAASTYVSQAAVYMHIWEKQGSSYSHVGVSVSAVAPQSGVDTIWTFKTLKIDTSKDFLFTFSQSKTASLSGLSLARTRVYKLLSDTTHKMSASTSYPGTGTQFAYMPVMTFTFTDTPSTATVHIEKGYYNTGTYEIFSGDMTKTLYDLNTNQTVGCKNNIFMTGKNGVSVPYISSLAAPTGSFDAYVNINHPVYLSYSKNFLVGDTPADTLLTYNGSTEYANYSVVGSPLISSDWVAYGFSSSNYIPVGITMPTTQYKMIMAINTLVTPTNNANFLANGSADAQNLFLTTSREFYFWDGSNSHGGGVVVDLNKKYWVQIIYDGTNTTFYLLRDNYYSKTTLPDISNWDVGATVSGNTLSGKTMWMGRGQNQNLPYNTGLIYLKDVVIYNSSNGVLWSAVAETAPSLTSSVGFVYDEGQGSTYWLPTSMTYNKSSIGTAANRCNVYLANNTGEDVSDLTISYWPPSGVTEYYINEYVYMDYAFSKILGCGKKPEELTVKKADDYTAIGTVTVSDEGVTTGFAANSYIFLPKPFDPQNYSTFEMVFKVKYKTSTSMTYQRMFGALNNTSVSQAVLGFDNNKFIMWLSSNGTSWNVASGTTGTTTLTDGTIYWIKFAFNGSAYTASLSTDGVNYTTQLTVSTTTKLNSNNSLFLIGNAELSGYFVGDIYLQDCYIKVNGSDWWRYKTDKAVQFNNWTYLGATINLPDVKKSLSDLTTVSGEAKELTMYLCGTNQTNVAVSGVALAASETATNAPYLGYQITFTDTNYDTISTLTKVGVRRKIYRGNIDASNDYILAYDPSNTDSINYTTFDASRTTELPISVPSTDTSFLYDEEYDTITYDNVVCSYVGEYIVNV